MKYDDRYIVELSRTAIFDDTPFAPEESVNWEYIYNKSIEQNITGLLFSAVSKLSKEYRPDKELYAKWQQKMLETIAVTSRQYNEFLKMSKVVSDAGIKMVGLKGCIIRNQYPVPELRTMGDFDVIVENDSLKAVGELFSFNGYDVTKDLFGIVADNKKAHWEIFTSLEEEFVINTRTWSEKILETSMALDGIYTTSYTYFLAHTIIHMGKHYIEKGAGIRNLCDIALFVSKYKEQIDFGILKNICDEQNFTKIFNYTLNALNQWYGVVLSGVDFEKTDTEKFVEYFLTNGIFGKHDNVLLRQFSLDEREDSKGLKRLLFPPVSTLRNRYKYLQKYPFLLPVAWIQRILYGRFTKKVKFSKMLKDIKGASGFSDTRLQWLKELDLIERH